MLLPELFCQTLIKCQLKLSVSPRTGNQLYTQAEHGYLVTLVARAQADPSSETFVESLHLIFGVDAGVSFCKFSKFHAQRDARNWLNVRLVIHAHEPKRE